MAHSLSELQQMGLQTPCDYCGKPPGEFCVTVQGAHVGAPAVPPVHGSRQAVPWRAWSIGYKDGQRTSANRTVWDLRKWADQCTDRETAAALMWAADRIEARV